MKTTYRRGGVALFSALIAGFAMPQATDAADAKIYHGNSCVAEYAHPGFTPSTQGLSFDSDSTGVALPDYVHCPIVRDNTGNTNGLAAANVRVNLITSGLVWCALYSRDADGDLVDSAAVATNTLGESTLTFGSLNTSVGGGTFSISCWLSGRVDVYGYMVDEY
jgi:hypothetical protein